MELILFKSSPLFIATLLALALDPMPYTLIDKIDHVHILFKEDIGGIRMYRIGAMANDLVKAVNGVKRTYRSKWVL